MSESHRLPQTFLRGLEADLRALCADARRRNPEVKEAAERVILSLKEADSAESEGAAADEAASAFCAACEALDPSAGTTVLGLQTKVALRAVSCLHKLLTHRALSPARLPEVLDALQRLSSPPVDDNLTLKVLQGLLSLLTVRSYAKSLSEEELSRAFSLLFILRTSRSSSTGTAASNALSAISQMSSGSDDGVIEQTSKAAFRQVSSDLFASAADSAVRTAVEKQAPTGATIPLSEFPSEARAAYSLFMDLCSAASKQNLTWLARTNPSEASRVAGLDLALALEVIDDGLASNIALFAGQPVFSDILSTQLCPVLHRLLRTTKEKSTLKSLLGLVVTLVRNYWRILKPDSEALLYALAKMTSSAEGSVSEQVTWGSTYAMESLRCIFRSSPNEPNILIDFVQAFDLGESAGRLIAGVVDAVCDSMALVDKIGNRSLPPTPVNGSMKPFANTITNTAEFLVAIATGLYIEVVRAAGDAVRDGLKNVARIFLMTDTTVRGVALLGKLVSNTPRLGMSDSSRGDDGASISALKALAGALGQLTVTATECELETVREKSFTTLAAACKSTIRAGSLHSSTNAMFTKRVTILFEVLFDVQAECRENLGRSWLPLMEALEQLDLLIRKFEAQGGSEGTNVSPLVTVLKPRLILVFSSTVDLKWSSCHDMISALVQCSRQSVALISKRVSAEDQTKTEVDPDVQVFGITSAETALLHAFRKENLDSDVLPCTVWQLLTGHLISVCTDSVVYSLRQIALGSLTRIACGAIPSGNPPFVGHDKIVTPFLDLFTASHPDVRAGSLSAVYTILESQGERLSGESAWAAVLKIVSTAAGSRISKTSKGDEKALQTSVEGRNSTQGSGTTSAPGMEMVSEAFKVVQVIADDFLTSLVERTLPVWIDVLGLYCHQNDDVNVALTSIGLLWRTADFFAKSTVLTDEDGLWVQLFEVLKEISMDDRPEVRNCAVKTLTGTLSAHSFRLSASAWNGCAARALLPLLEEVMQGGSSGQSDETASGVKGRGDVQLLLHHSRDTPRKQWNETRVLALAGVAKVLRTAMPRLAVLQDGSGRPLFLMLTDGGTDGLWRKMLRAAGVAAGSRDGEVAVAGVSALLELLNAAGFAVGIQNVDTEASTGQKLELSVSAPASLGGAQANESTASSWISGVIGSSETTETYGSKATEIGIRNEQTRVSTESTIMLWEAVWSALSEAIGRGETAGSSNRADGGQGIDELKIVDEKALQMLAEGLLEARVNLGDKFTTGSSKVLVEVLMHLALGRRMKVSMKDNSTGLNEVQEVTLNGLQKMSFGDDKDSWISLVQGLFSIVAEESKEVGRSSKLVRRVLEIIGHLYTDAKLPADVKRSELTGLLSVVGRIMLMRDEGEQTSGNRGVNYATSASVGGASDGKDGRPLWIEATEVVMMAMRSGTDHACGAQCDLVLGEFVKIMEAFLYSAQRVQKDLEYRRDVAESERAEDYDIRLTECVQDALSQIGPETSEDTKRRLVGLLSRGAEEGKASGRPRFVRSCQKRLFRLADAVWADGGGHSGGEHRHIAEESNKRVVETCGRVLGQFIADGQRAGRCPLPAARRAEAVFLLQQLRRLNSYDADRQDGFSKKHLVTLYPRLCECVDSRDEAVRQLARELLDEAAPVARDGAKQGVPGLGLRV